MYLLAVSLPLFSSLISGFGGRWVGSKGASIITCLFIFVSALCSTVIFFEVAIAGYPCHILVSTWIDSGIFNASWGFLFDTLTSVIILVVTYVSSLVHLYSVEYIAHDAHKPRFISYLSIFTFFILILVTADNFIQIFLGWEGVGLSSYLLINFWYTRLAANKAAIKAIIINRIGDFSLSLGILGVFYLFNSVDYATVFSLAPFFTEHTLTFLTFKLHSLTLICILLFVGAIGKSAQLGLHTWLPDAIEGPTPVSALIHAATIVTAGVFLVARCSPIFEFTPIGLSIVGFVGGTTAFFAASTGAFQNDIKRVIAYSTCSQLGYIIFACGTSNYAVSMFHLANHAFFKALLFLGAGSVIHALGDEQDIRRIGGLVHLLPFTYVVMLIGSLSLVGFPFLTGFYSKDLILELVSTTYSVPGSFVYWIGSLAVLFTAFYSFRLLFLTFLNDPNISKVRATQIHESPFLIMFPLIILVFGSIFIGYLIKEIMVGIGTDFWGASLFVMPLHISFVESEFIPLITKWLPFWFSIIGILLAVITNVLLGRFSIYLQLSQLGRRLTFFFNKKWYWDKLYNSFIVNLVINFGYYISFKTLDRGIIEIFGPYGMIKFVPFWAKQVSGIQTGQLAHYAFIILIGLTGLLTVIELWDLIFEVLDSRLFSIFLISIIYITSCL